jgi:hypothetical protein
MNKEIKSRKKKRRNLKRMVWKKERNGRTKDTFESQIKGFLQ